MGPFLPFFPQKFTFFHKIDPFLYLNRGACTLRPFLDPRMLAIHIVSTRMCSVMNQNRKIHCTYLSGTYKYFICFFGLSKLWLFYRLIELKVLTFRWKKLYAYGPVIWAGLDDFFFDGRLPRVGTNEKFFELKKYCSKSYFCNRLGIVYVELKEDKRQKFGQNELYNCRIKTCMYMYSYRSYTSY